MSVFLLINLVVIAIPIVFSFFKEVKINWGALALSIVAIGSGFMLRNLYMVRHQLLDFNPDLILGVKFAGLPIEEIAFFIIFPYAFLFIYKWIENKYANYRPVQFTYFVSLIVTVISILLALFYYDRPYSLLTFGSFAIVNGIVYFAYSPKWYPTFLIAFLFIMFPYFLIDGTITILQLDNIAIYSESAVIGTYIFSIPLEDLFNFYLLFLCTIVGYESFVKVLSSEYENDIM